MLTKKQIKIKKLIEDSIKEHNKIWENIGINLTKYKVSAGYRYFNLSEDQISTIASGLARKIKILL